MSPACNASGLPHVVHYIRHLREEEGGVVRAVLDLTQALAAHGCRVTIITTDVGGKQPTPPNGNGPHIELVELPRPLFGRKPKELSKRLSDLFQSASVAHFHTLWDPHNLRMAEVARKADIAYVVSTHGMLNDHAIALKRFKKRVFLAVAGSRFLRDSYRLHCTAEGEKRQVLSRTAGTRAEVIPLMFDAAQYTRLPGRELAETRFDCLSIPAPKLLFLSRLNPIKGPDILISAAAKLRERRDFHLVLAGPGEPGYVKNLKALVREHDLQSRVSFVGMVSDRLKLSLYQACDLFVLPTMQENFGMVFPEALACGVPVITTDQVDTALELGEAGARLVPRTADDFAEGIEDMLADRDKLQALGQKGREYVFRWLDPDKVVQEYIALYNAAASFRNDGG